MNPCIFCRIVARTAPAQIVFEDEWVMAFRDLHPVAPTHLLIIPRRHIESVNALEEGDEALAGRLLTTAQRLARTEGVAETGYRLILNTGLNGGQTIAHLHLHLIGGQRMRHPIG